MLLFNCLLLFVFARTSGYCIGCFLMVSAFVFLKKWLIASMVKMSSSNEAFLVETVLYSTRFIQHRICTSIAKKGKKNCFILTFWHYIRLNFSWFRSVGSPRLFVFEKCQVYRLPRSYRLLLQWLTGANAQQAAKQASNRWAMQTRSWTLKKTKATEKCCNHRK